MTRKEEKRIQRENRRAYMDDFAGLGIGISEMSLDQIKCLSDSDLQKAWNIALSQPKTGNNVETVRDIENEMSRRDNLPQRCPKCGTNGDHYCPADVAVD